MTEDLFERSRITVVADVRIAQIDPENKRHPRKSDQPVWVVEVDTKAGSFPVVVNSFSRLFDSKEAALGFAGRYPAGSEIDDQTNYFGELFSRSQFESHFQLGLLARPWKIIAGADQDVIEILQNAGMSSPVSDITELVADALGNKRLEQLRVDFGARWGTAAVLEYCWYRLPHSSPTFLAAAYQYHRHITGDEFSAGYLRREIEFVNSGVEVVANRALEMRRSAGEKGSKTSSSARKNRIVALMDALEATAEKNPDVPKKLGVKALLSMAVEQAVQANSKLWSQGQGQAEEYLGEIRRGEAGEELKLRYDKLFAPKTA